MLGKLRFFEITLLLCCDLERLLRINAVFRKKRSAMPGNGRQNIKAIFTHPFQHNYHVS